MSFWFFNIWVKHLEFLQLVQMEWKDIRSGSQQYYLYEAESVKATIKTTKKATL